MSEEQIDFDAERGDVFKKLKDGYNVVASVVVDDAERVAVRLRAAHILAFLAKTLRLFLLDEEQVDQLAKKVDEIEKELAKSKSEKRRDWT